MTDARTDKRTKLKYILEYIKIKIKCISKLVLCIYSTCCIYHQNFIFLTLNFHVFVECVFNSGVIGVHKLTLNQFHSIHLFLTPFVKIYLSKLYCQTRFSNWPGPHHCYFSLFGRHFWIWKQYWGFLYYLKITITALRNTWCDKEQNWI